MTIINASAATEAVNLSLITDQFDYQIQDAGGNNSSTSYSWLSSGNDDIQATGTNMDFTDPTPDFGNVTSMDVDLSNNDFGNPDVTMTSITALNGGGAIASARLGVMVDSIELFFDEVMSFNDTITGSAFNDTFKAGGGNDNLSLGSGNDGGFGGDGNDTINGGGGNDTVSGEAGNDSLLGSSGDDSLNGGSGADTMNGGDQDDVYTVDNVGDVVAESFNDAIGGDDLVNASATHVLGFGIEDLTLTGSGDIDGTGNGNGNVITGNGGDNVLRGEGGSDTITGGAGTDSIVGGSGADSLNGGTGADTLVGGAGGDTLVGGGGNDVFDFNAIADSGAPVAGANVPPFAARDVIDGFTGAGAAAGDVIDLSGIDAVAGGADNGFNFLGVAQNPFPAPLAAGSLYLRNEGGETVVYGNVDGDVGPEIAIRIDDGATLASAYDISDFIL